MTESNRIEYKQELNDKLEKEVVAFLNYREGGLIYIGIAKTGEVIGVEDCDAVQLKIKDRLRNNILPSCLGLFDEISYKIILPFPAAAYTKISSPMTNGSAAFTKATVCQGIFQLYFPVTISTFHKATFPHKEA